MTFLFLKINWIVFISKIELPSLVRQMGVLGRSPENFAKSYLKEFYLINDRRNIFYA